MIMKKKKRYGKPVRSRISYVLIASVTILNIAVVILALQLYFLYSGGISPIEEYSDFNLTDSAGYLQSDLYYPNLRFPSYNISYGISSHCGEIFRSYINNSISIFENNTVLRFYRGEYSASQINFDCISTTPSINPFEGDTTLGEGGPEYIIPRKKFLEINSSIVRLYKLDDCPPHVAFHEMLHALGFKHNENPASILYPIQNCETQKINEYFYTRINEIYNSTVV